MYSFSLDPATRRTSASKANLGLGLIALAALLYSLIPVSLDQAVNNIAPVTVGLGMVAGYALANSIDRQRLSGKIEHWSKGSISVSYRAIWEHLRDANTHSGGAWLGLAIVGISATDYVVFAFATVHVDAAVAASMFEAWPMLWLFIVARTDASSHGPRKRTRRPWNTYALMLAAVPAVALIAGSAGPMPNSSTPNSQYPVLGIILAALAPVVGAGGAAAILFTDRMLFERRHIDMKPEDAALYRRWQPDGHQWSDSQVDDLKSVMSRTSLIANRIPLMAGMLPFAIYEAGIGTRLFWTSLLGGLLVGALLHGPASISLHEAHFRTDRREIIAMQYLSPLLALVWLALFSGITILRIDLLLLGTVTVVAINILINLDPETARQDEAARQR